jgi:GT2 family glycosyltransferase
MSVMLVLQVLAWGIAAAWVWKAVEAAWGMPRVTNLMRPEFDVAPRGEPRVVVIVPARDEGVSVRECLTSLLTQDYANLRIVAVDDRSSDVTGRIMDELAEVFPDRLRVLHITALPEGWLGKPHALAAGAREAIAMFEAEYLLFTDADVFFEPQVVRRSLAQAVAMGADHFVTSPTLILRSAGEAVLLGFMQVMGVLAARPWKIADAKARDAIGIGAFNLMRVMAYQELGGFEALRMQIVEDVTLARRVKKLGMRQRVAFAPGMVSLHWAAGAMGVVNGMTKNLFAVFGFRPELLLGACAWVAVFWLGPLVGLVFAATRAPAVVALIAIVVMYVEAWRVGGIPAWTVVAFPASVVLFLYSMLRSMVVTLRAGGVTWRGTFYPLAELRRNVEKVR